MLLSRKREIGSEDEKKEKRGIDNAAGLEEVLEVVEIAGSDVLRYEKETSTLSIDFKRYKKPEHPRVSSIIIRIRCSTCGVRNGSMKKCSRCKNVVYCSRECQVRDWKNHRNVCKKLGRAERELL